MPTASITSSSKITTIITFAGGTLLLLGFYFTMNFSIAMMGMVYSLIMLIVNLGVIITIAVRLNRDKIPWIAAIKSIGLMFINLPVFILYCWVGIMLSNFVRITFVNPHKTSINNIKVSGCDKHFIPQLAPGASKTIWAQIPNDCGINIHYQIGQQTKQEDVTGYVTHNGGYITTFKIGTNQMPYDRNL